MAEKTVVGKEQLTEISEIGEAADQHGHLFIDFLGRIVHPGDADMVDLQDGAALAQLLQLLETRMNEDMAQHHLARIGTLFF